MILNRKHKLLVTIVKKGLASKIVKATRAAGAEGGTILIGTGTGIHEKRSFLGIEIEPEKEMILTLVREEDADQVCAAIEASGKLNKPGNGIGFMLDAGKIAGICHLMGLGTGEGGI